MTTKLLDSNVCIALLRGVPAIQERYASEAERHTFVLSAISVSELWYGVAKSTQPDRHGDRLKQFLGSIETIDFDLDDARAAGQVRAQLSRRGAMIGANDLLIGSQALARGLPVVTGNVREFSRIPGLAVEDWSRPQSE